MRIIAGSRARFKLISPKDDTTRPITDRVKEALFSILYPRLEGAFVADIFCGTGSLGLEAISRGASHAIMVDLDFDAVKRLRQNIEHLGFAQQTSVRKLDAWLYGIPTVEPIKGQINLVFVDPPFAQLHDSPEHSRLAKLMRKMAHQVALGALAVVRHEARVELPGGFKGWQQSDHRVYGNMALTFYTRAEDETQSSPEDQSV